MDKVSIIIPERNEPYCYQTVNDLLQKAEGDIEIIVNVDGEWPKMSKDKRVTYLHPDKPIGMRGGINEGLKRAKGKYIMKVDAHCLFAPAYDTALKADMQENWLVIPRRYSLHAENWDRDFRMPIKDYHYLSYPKIYSPYGFCMYPQEWKDMTMARSAPRYDIDDTMTMQGSCWFADRKYFMKHRGFLDDRMDHYTTFAGEPLEVGLNYWLGGGEMKVNKKTWYAHLFKNKGFYQGKKELRDYKKNLINIAGHDYACKHWVRNEEPNMIHPLEWLIEKFWPVPTWPDDWKEELKTI